MIKIIVDQESIEAAEIAIKALMATRARWGGGFDPHPRHLLDTNVVWDRDQLETPDIVLRIEAVPSEKFLKSLNNVTSTGIWLINSDCGWPIITRVSESSE